MRYKILLGSCLGTFIGVAAVSTNAESVIETLVVTASESDAVSLATGTAMIKVSDQLPGLRIDSAELLQGLPGVQADSRSNYAQDTRVTLRGFGARSAFGVRGVDLQVDGVPLTMPDGQGQLSSVALDGVAEVEVLRGPIAALYGNGAGGVISLRSRAPENNQLQLGYSAGEYNLSRPALQGQWRGDNVGVRVQAARFTTDGHRAHSAAEKEQLGAQLYYTSAGGVEAIVRLDSDHDSYLQDPLGLSPEQWRENPRQVNSATELFDTHKTVDHQQFSLTLRQAEGQGRWQTTLWSGARDITQRLAFTGAGIGSAGGIVDLRRDFYGINANYSYDFMPGGTLLTATLGAELAAMDDRRRGYVNDYGVIGDLRRDELGQVDSRDIYSVLQWQPSARWEFYGGARYSDLEFTVDDYFVVPDNPDDSGGRDYSQWSTAYGVNYRVDDHWTVFVSQGRGFESPTLTEMAYSADNDGLNIALDAANNRQREAGVRYDTAATELALTFFEVDTTNEIVVDRSVGGRTTYRNAAGTERQGVELTGRFALAERWSAWVNFNYLEADYSAGDWQGNQLPGIARDNHYAQVRWQPWVDERLTLALAVRHRSKVATGDENLVWAPAATTADFAISSRIDLGDWAVSGWVKAVNLTDENYVGSVIVNQSNGRSFEPAPGRHLNAAIAFTYQW
jgi:iron complex outermembrane receptor protein